MRTAIVIGTSHHNTLGVIRSLGRKKIYSDVIIPTGEEDSFLKKSRYVNSIKILESYEEIPSYLIDTYSTFSNKPVVFCCCDKSSSVIDLHYDILSKYLCLPGTLNSGTITHCMNKQIMCEQASANNLIIPYGQMLDCSIGIGKLNITFPCIIKPLVSMYGSKKHILICHNSSELNKYLEKGSYPLLQIQEFINKEFEYQLIGCSLEYGNRVYIPGRSRIIHQPNTTNTGFLHYEPLDGNEPIDECKSFLRAIGYSGLFSIEFLRGKDGRDYFMEINFRNDGNSICVTDSGVNLPYIWYAANSGISYLNNDDISILPIYVIPEFAILDIWYQGKLSFFRMLKDFIIANSSMDYADDDPGPTNGRLGILIYALFLFIKKPFKYVSQKIFSDYN